MLKLLKWAYDLGVRQERVRISAHLQNVSRYSEYESERMFAILDSEKTPKRTKSQLDFKMAVEDKIRKTVDEIMKPQNSDYFGYSIMFPDDDHKERGQ